MPVLLMGLLALMIFGVIGLMLFAASVFEHKSEAQKHEVLHTTGRPHP